MKTTLSPYRVLLSTVLLLAVLCSTFLLLGLLTHPTQAAPPTYVDGPITTNTTWTVAGSPYILTEIVNILEGITLTVEPGVTVMGQLNTAVFAHGHLQAIGTPDNPITFTAENNTPGGWYGIGVTSSANFNHVTIDKATWNLGVWNLENGYVLIENSTISNSSDYALIANLDILHRLHMSNVSFVNNAQNRVLIEVFSDSSNFLMNDVTLTAQPGLEGYEVYDKGILFIIESGVTLTLEPGVTFMSPVEIAVNGHLEAIGTETNPVIFTSPSDSPSDEWFGIVAWDGTTHLTHTIVRHACLGLGITEFSGPQVLENSTISESTCVAIVVASSALHQLHMFNVTFSNNVLNRVMIDNSYQNFLIADVTLSSQPGLEGYDVYQHSSTDATLIVPEGISLTLQPGTTLIMYDDESLKVSGELNSIGTSQNPITFTSSANSAAGEWAGMVVSGTADFAHTTIRYAQTGVSVTGGSVSAVCTTFTDNLADGIFVDSTGNPTVTISDSNIFGNAGWNILNNNPTQVDARYNWWGNPAGPGSTASGNILTAPWLTEPSCPLSLLYLPLLLRP